MHSLAILPVFGAATRSIQTVASYYSSNSRAKLEASLKIENNLSRPVRNARPTRSMGALSRPPHYHVLLPKLGHRTMIPHSRGLK